MTMSICRHTHTLIHLFNTCSDAERTLLKENSTTASRLPWKQRKMPSPSPLIGHSMRRVIDFLDNKTKKSTSSKNLHLDLRVVFELNNIIIAFFSHC